MAGRRRLSAASMPEPVPGPLGRLLSAGRPLVVPGAADAITARLIEQIGFEAVYLTGAGVTNAYLGVADMGLLSLPELTAHVAAVRDAVDIPIIVDADTGFGGPLNVARTMRALERAGAAAIELEDQTFPKRCGHFTGKSVVSTGEMLGRLAAALDARSDPSVLLIARTDARAVNGLDDAIERACAYAEAGADITFVEAPATKEEVEAIPRRIPAPQMLNLVEGGLTPMLPYDDVRRTGYAIVLYANAALRAGLRGMQITLTALRRDGSTSAVLDQMATWNERQALVRKDELDALGAQYEARALSYDSAQRDAVAAQLLARQPRADITEPSLTRQEEDAW